MADMSSYLSTKVADYITTELSITPQVELIEEGKKQQYQHEYDSGDIEIVTTSGTFFIVTLQWNYLSISDAETILDFYHDTNKANGKKRSFYWQHPLDGNTYVARFGSDLTQIDNVKKPNAKEISTVTLRIEGVKA